MFSEAYTYDRASNRTGRYDARPGARLNNRDWEFDYDGLHRLAEARRGVREDDTTWIPGPKSHKWVLDMLGNWDELHRDPNGGGYSELEERTHNAANEIVDCGLQAARLVGAATPYDTGGLS